MATILRCLKNMKLTGHAVQTASQHRSVNLIIVSCTRHRVTHESSRPTDCGSYTNRQDMTVNKLIGFLAAEYRLQRYTSSVYISDAVVNLRNSGYVQNHHGLLLLRCCGNPTIDMTSDEKRHLTEEVVDVLRTCNIVRDLMYYNVLLQVKVENNCDFSPSNILLEMQNDLIEPNDQTYTILLEYYCKAGNVTEANNIVKIMENLKYPLTQKIYRLLIMGHAEARDMKSAENILDRMKHANIVPDNDVYAALMCGYAKTGDINNIRRTFSESGNTTFSNANFLDVAYTLIVNKHSAYVSEILACVRKPNTVPGAEVQFIGKLIEIKNFKLPIDMFINIMPILKLYKLMDLFVSSILCRLMSIVNETPEIVLQTCIHLDKNCDIPHFIDCAIKASFATKNIDITYALFDYKMKKGEVLKSHFFWPLFARARHACDIKGVFNILESMVGRFGVQPCSQTLRVYVVPCIFERSELCRKRLLQYKIPAVTVDTAIVLDLLYRNRLVDTHMYVKKYPGPYNYETLKSHLKKAVLITTDALNYFIVMNVLHNGTKNVGTTDKEIFLNAACNPYLEDNLMHMIEEGLEVKRVLFKIIEVCWACNTLLSSSLIKLIHNFTNSDIPPNIHEILDLMLKLPTMPEYTFTFLNAMLSNASSVKFQISLIFHIYNEDNEDLMLDTLKLFKLRNIDLLPRSRFRILKFFCQKKNLTEARKQMLDLKNGGQLGYIHHYLVLQYIQLLVCQKSFDEAKQLLQDFAKVAPAPETIVLDAKLLCNDILGLLIDNGNVDIANEFFMCFKTLKFAEGNSVASSVAIKYYIDQCDIKNALQSFAEVCKTNTLPPYKHELTKLIVTRKDGTALQNLMDTCIKVQDKKQTVSELLMDLIAFNHVDRALQLYKTHDTSFGDDGTKCGLPEYLEQYDSSELKALYNNAGSLPWNLQSELYDNILRIYVRRNDWESGLIMWDYIQEHNFVFTDAFIKNMKALLWKNNKYPPGLPADKIFHNPNVNRNGTNETKPSVR